MVRTFSAAAGASDGRRAWRERNRNAVVDALLDLYQEGVMSPGAQDVAERSGVSRRSIFRYFDDMDDMYRVAIERHNARVSHLFEIEDAGEGALHERIERLVQQRMRLFAKIAPVARVANLQAPAQPVIAAELARADALMLAQMGRHFAPELDRLSAGERRATLAAAGVLTSFPSFDLMQRNQATAEATAAMMRRGLTALLTPANGEEPA
jgi:AcrR family transcriptional regulator